MLEISFYFLIYAFLGWCIEVMYATIRTKKFINRGFLNGPYCSIYGFGAILILYLLNGYKYNIFIFYLASVFLTSLLEYITGFILEKVFNEKWWDYTENKYNIKGYICLEFSLLWGIACVILVYLIHPITKKIFEISNKEILIIFVSISFIIMFIDFVYSIFNLIKLKIKVSQIKKFINLIRNFSDGIGKGISDTTLDIEEYIEKYNNLKKEKYKRIIKSYPSLEKIFMQEKFKEAINQIKKYKDEIFKK